MSYVWDVCQTEQGHDLQQILGLEYAKYCMGIAREVQKSSLAWSLRYAPPRSQSLRQVGLAAVCHDDALLTGLGYCSQAQEMESH